MAMTMAMIEMMIVAKAPVTMNRTGPMATPAMPSVVTSISPRIQRHQGGPSLRNSRSMAPPKARIATRPPIRTAQVPAKMTRKRIFRRRSASAIRATIGAGS
jgi:hypothetical protein